MSEICYSKNIEVTGEYDVVVCGGGLSGVAAAISAARKGVRCALIESTGKPGGISVSGMLGAVSGHRISQENVVGGFLRELLTRCRNVNGVNDMDWCAVFDPEVLNEVLLEMLDDAGVELWLYTKLADAVRSDSRIEHIILACKEGLRAMSAKVFIDATGDGDLAFAAGCDFELGREEDGLMQSATLVFRIGGVVLEQMPPTPEITELWRKHGPKDVPTDHAAIKLIKRENAFSEIIINMSHILCFDGTRSRELTRAKIEGTRQGRKIMNFFRKHVPGFANAYINVTAENIGVRETRRVIGDYLLTKDDVLAAKDFTDQIARCLWGIDIHNPEGTHSGISYSVTKSYGIPYRCITPVGIDNLYIAGRPISADHMAFSSTRIASTCLALGEAAGLASVMVLDSGDSRSVDISALQEQLRAAGAVIERQQLTEQEK